MNGTQGWGWPVPWMLEIDRNGGDQYQEWWRSTPRNGCIRTRMVEIGIQAWRWPVPWMLEIPRNGDGQYQEWWRLALRDGCIRTRDRSDWHLGKEAADTMDGGDWCPRMKVASFRDVGDGCCTKMAVPSFILRPEAATLGRLAGRQTSGHWGRVTWERSQEPHAAAAGGKFIPRQRASGGLGWMDGLALKAIQTPIKPSG